MRVVLLVALALVLGIGAALLTPPAVPAALEGTVADAAVRRDAGNALRGTLTATTPEPERLVVELVSPAHALRVTEEEATEEHEVPLLGLRAGTTYDVLLAVADGGPAASVGELTTGELPADLPPVDVRVAASDRVAPGLTLFNQVYQAPPGGDGLADVGFLTAIDETGAVVWYHREQLNIQDAIRLDDGNLLVVSDETGVREFTPTGEVVAEWRGTSPGTDAAEVGEGLGPDEVIRVDIDSMHHDAQATAEGDILTLRRLEQDIAFDEPLCSDDEDFDGTEEIVGDAIVVFDPATGEVLQEHSLFDMLDPRDDVDPSEADYCVSYLDRHYPDGAPRDWTHANAVTLSPDGDTWLVSLRHVDLIIGVRAVDEPSGPVGSLRWAFGPGGDFELTEGRWSWHQHAPEWQDDDTILVYDNGNGRDDAPEPYSRAVEYDIDEEAMTATQTWEHVMPNRLYASFLGDADSLEGPGGETVLITHGGQSSACAAPNDEENAIWGQLVEVDRATGEIILDVTTQDLEECVGWAIYRAERIDQIHPAGYDVEVLRR